MQPVQINTLPIGAKFICRFTREIERTCIVTGHLNVAYKYVTIHTLHDDGSIRGEGAILADEFVTPLQ